MSTGLLLDASCAACGYEVRNLALGATARFTAGAPDGWLAVITECPVCREMVDAVLTRDDLARSGSQPELRCPHCGSVLPPPNQSYPDLTIARIANSDGRPIGPQTCPYCREPALIVQVVGTFE